MKSYPQPPGWMLRFLEWFCKPWYLDTITGDLFEIYDRQYRLSPSKARRQFFWNVLKFFRWRYIKDLEDFQPKSRSGMFKNFFRVSLRSMRKNTTQSVLNILGLAIGIACCMLILMHITSQIKYDKHIDDLDRIYRVVLNRGGPYTPARLVKQMHADFPEVVTGTRVNGAFESVIEIGDGFLRQSGCVVADSTFFEVFPNKFIFGEPRTCLNRPNTVVLTQSVSEKIFGNKNPVGEVLKANGTEYEITAVVRDEPATSTIPYKVVIAIPWATWATKGWWTGNNFLSYLKLKQNADPELLEAKFPAFVERYVGPELLAFNSQYESFEDYLADGNNHSFSLVPMKEIHLHHPRLTLGKPGSYSNLVVFSLIAFFILIIACINYINMSTARSSLRAKEIGMRKVLGSVKSLIAQQFLIESFMITLIAVVLGVLIGVGALPFFNQVSDSSYSLTDFMDGQNIAWFTVILIFVGLVSGSYPALYLSSFKPILALRGEAERGGNKKIRQGLVVFQFAISIFLISATLIVFRQVSFMSNRPLGLNAEQTFIIQGAGNAIDQYEAFKNDLLSHADISAIGISNQYPSSFLADWNYLTDDQVQVSPYNLFVSADIADVWGLNIIEGRFFDDSRVSDTAAIVVNQSLVKTLGWESPVGQILSRGNGRDFRVIGVVEDFVTGSAKRGDYPLLFRTGRAKDLTSTSGSGYFMVRVSGNYQSAIRHMEAIWQKFVPKYPFDGLFLDDSFNRLYNEERRFGKLFIGFSTIAVVIACVGLFALASFTLDRKRKEIAIRKVMGAQVYNIMVLVGKSFLALILTGAFIALPAVYYLGNNWLEDYVYRIDIGFFHLAIPLLVVIFIAFTTIVYQTYRSAVNNPVNALKEE